MNLFDTAPHSAACPTPFRVPLFPLLFLTLAWTLAPRYASAVPMEPDPMEASVIISDLKETRITAEVKGGTNNVNETKMAEEATPEFITFTIAVDGTVAAGRGLAVLLESKGKVSDILEVSVTPKKRGNPNDPIDFFDAVVTFTSDPDEKPLDLSGYGLTEAILDKIMDAGLIEDGTQQNIGARLIDIATGKPLNTGGLFIVAASDVDVPEPSSLLLVGPGLLALAVLSRRRRIGAVPGYLND